MLGRTVQHQAGSNDYNGCVCVWKRQFVCAGSRCCACNTIQAITEQRSAAWAPNHQCFWVWHAFTLVLRKHKKATIWDMVGMCVRWAHTVTYFSSRRLPQHWYLFCNVFVPPEVYISRVPWSERVDDWRWCMCKSRWSCQELHKPFITPKQWERRNSSYLDKAEW